MLQFLSSQEDVCFWPIESDGVAPFRWTRKAFVLDRSDRAKPFATLHVGAPVSGFVVEVHRAAAIETLPLVDGWQFLDVNFGDDSALDLAVRVPEDWESGDARELGIMLRGVVFHDDQERHETLSKRQANAYRNDQDYALGREVLTSVPPALRLTVSTACNIANEKACVYCSWDWAKRMERDAPAQTPEFIAGLGDFIRLASVVNDCSYGEPPLDRRFGEVVAAATSHGRLFEFTTNGQPLGARKRADLLGRTARVHVSIDAASPEGYQRYRDHRFSLVIENLRHLCAEKASHAGLPEVYVSFIVMRSNLVDVPEFLALMKDVGVDRVTFRALYVDDHLESRKLSHYGQAFDYDAECLDAAELEALSISLRAEAVAVGIPMTIEWDEFVTNTTPARADRPLCNEPWRTAYLLNRGVMPCCYAREPLVTWSEIATDTLEESVKAALNSEPFRALRRDLAKGRLGSFCESTQGCPIVKKIRLKASLAESSGDGGSI